MRRILSNSLIGILFLSYFGAIFVNSDLFGNLLSPIVTFICGYFVLYYLCLNEKIKLLKISGLLLSLSIFNWALWDLIWGVTDLVFKINPETVNFIEYGYSLTSILLLVSIITNSYSYLEKWNGIQLLLDSMILAPFLAALIWVGFFSQDIDRFLLMQRDIIAMITVLIDFLIIAWISIWLFSRKGRISNSLKLFLLGTSGFFISDIIYYYEFFFSSYDPNDLLDGGYIIAFLLMTLSGIAKSKDSDLLYEKIKNQHHTIGKEIILVIISILLITADFDLKYIILMLANMIFYIFFTGYIQKNIFREEVFEKEKQLNSELEKKVEERTEALSNLLNRDVVTGLYSRRYFSELLKNTVLQLNANENVLLFYIDLNGYRTIKTVFGNYIGDKILIEMSKRLKAYQQENHYVLASYGEDVFVLFMKGQYSYSEAEVIAENLIENCSDIYEIEEHGIRVTINIGISIYPNDSKSSDELIRHADIAVSQSRREGFNKITIFDEQLGALIAERKNVEILLKKVNYNEEFYLHYQPQIATKNESLVGLEALIRWKTKSGQFISPGEFIPIAEETGEIIPIGYWVMQQVIRQVAIWNKEYAQKMRVAINISALQLSERNFVQRLKEELDQNGVAPSQLELEIIESIQLEEIFEMKEILKEIRELGVTIAIDDFGTGYSSLYYLKNLPADRIKISKSLIDKIDEDIYDYNIVKSVISIANVKGVTVIAEGVETREQVECLKELQCDEIQGYYYAKPMAISEINEKWLQNDKNIFFFETNECSAI